LRSAGYPYYYYSALRLNDACGVSLLHASLQLAVAELQPSQQLSLCLSDAHLYSALPFRVTAAVASFCSFARRRLASCLFLDSAMIDAQLRVPLPPAVDDLQATASLASSALAATPVSLRGVAIMSEASPSPDAAPLLCASLSDAPRSPRCANGTATLHCTTSDASSPLPPPCDLQPCCARRALRLVGGGDTLPEQSS